MEFDRENMPKHIAIIMDGNRRWARAQGKPASFGHKAGPKTLEKIVRYANKIGLEYGLNQKENQLVLDIKKVLKL